jgi:glycosyl transferase family 87
MIEHLNEPSPLAQPPTPIQSTGFGSGWGVRAGMVLCLALLALYGVLWGNTVQSSGGPEAYVRQTDFRAALTAATVIGEGHGPQLYTLPAQQEAENRVVRGYEVGGMIPYAQPPYWALLLVPFVQAGLTLQLVFTVWTLISAAAAGLSLGLLAAGWPTARNPSWLLMLAATSFFPLITALMIGQSTPLVLLALAGASAALKYDRDELAGGVLALALVQPTLLPVILLGLILGRRWRVLAGFAVAAFGLVVVIMPILGVTWPLQYAAFALDSSHWVLGRSPGGVGPQTWRALFTDTLGAPLAPLGLIAGGLATVALLVVAWRGIGAERDDTGTLAWDRAWALTLLLALPADPVLGPTGLALALVPGWILASHVANDLLSRRLRSIWAALLIGGYLITTPVVTLLDLLPPYAPLVWLLALAGLLVWQIRTQAAPLLAPDEIIAEGEA